MRALLGAGLALWVAPAGAVLLLDETWEADGGEVGDFTAGFDKALALAAEPQFAAVLKLDSSEQWCSGTWLGNDENDHAFVLTAAHCLYRENGEAPDYAYVTDGGTRRKAVAQTLHPDYDDAEGNEVGASNDVAVIELDGPIEDAGDPPVLYDGSDEKGEVATFVGYGERGTGQLGPWGDPNQAYDAKAAVRNIIDGVGDPEAGDDFTSLDFDFDSLNGGAATSSEGDDTPVDEMEGMAATGDSGGSLWIETADGWRIAGVSSNGGKGDGSPEYGGSSRFARVSAQIDFIRSVFPDAQTGE